jgi:hypothetical protein
MHQVKLESSHYRGANRNKEMLMGSVRNNYARDFCEALPREWNVCHSMMSLEIAMNSTVSLAE